MPERTQVEARYLYKEKILEDFKESIKGIEDLNCPMDDDYLQKFLAARKYRLNDALKLLKNFFELKKNNMDFFRSICPMNLRELCRMEQQTLILKHRDPLGRKVLVLRTCMWNPDLLSFDQMTMVKYYLLEEMLSCPETRNNGLVVIIDDSGMTLGYSRRYMHEMQKRCRLIMNYVQGCFPGQVKGIHFVNNTYLYKILFNLLKPFISVKMRKRFFVHGSKIQNLYEHVPASILPTYLGGKLNVEDAEDTQLMNQLFSKEIFIEANDIP